MRKKLIIFGILFGLFICLSCSKENNDDYLRCSICNKIITTDYDICANCKSNICPSCIIVNSYNTGLGKIKQCPKCGYQWNVRRGH